MLNVFPAGENNPITNFEIAETRADIVTAKYVIQAMDNNSANQIIQQIRTALKEQQRARFSSIRSNSSNLLGTYQSSQAQVSQSSPVQRSQPARAVSPVQQSQPVRAVSPVQTSQPAQPVAQPAQASPKPLFTQPAQLAQPAQPAKPKAEPNRMSFSTMQAEFDDLEKQLAQIDFSAPAPTPAPAAKAGASNSNAEMGDTANFEFEIDLDWS